MVELPLNLAGVVMIIRLLLATSLSLVLAAACGGGDAAPSDVAVPVEKSKAVQELDEAIRLNPQDAQAYHKRGVAYGNLGQQLKAIQDFDEAISLNPKLAKFYGNRGVAYGKLGQPERAIEDYDEAISLDPNWAAAYHIRAITYTVLGKDDDAKEDVESAVALGIDRAELESAIEEIKSRR